MKLTVQKDVLVRGLQRTQSIVDKKNVIPVLSNVLLEADKSTGLHLTATDLEVGVKAKYPALVSKAGRVAAPCKNLYDIVKELPNQDISITLKDNYWIEIKCGAAFFKIVGQDPDEFPNLPTIDKRSFFSLPANTIVEMIDRTIFAVSNDLTRYDLNGVYLEKLSRDSIAFLRMIATDGHRLSLMDYEVKDGDEIEFDKGVIIPKKGLNEIKKLLNPEGDIELGFVDNNFVITNESNSLVLVIRLINGEFPDYNRVIPKNNDKHLTIEKSAFQNSLRRISVLSAEQSRSVRLSISRKKLTVSASNPNLGEAKEELPLEYEGETVNIGFNASYFLDVLNTMPRQEKIDLELSDPLSPTLLKGHTYDGNINIVMPMRLQETAVSEESVTASDESDVEDVDAALADSGSDAVADSHAS